MAAIVNRAIRKIPELHDIHREDVFCCMDDSHGPVVLRKLAEDWPLVQAGLSSSGADVGGYLLKFYQGAPVTVFAGPPEAGGRIFYTDDLSQTNFEQRKSQLDDVLAQIQEQRDSPEPRTIYMGSMTVDYCLPGLREQNSLPPGGRNVSVRIWLGNRSTVAAHYDAMDNIACVCAGRRRFTLFPPEQLANLYVGPLDFTPAGQPVSMVDVRNPDLDRFPRYTEALKYAQTAELEPGDAIYIPAMWWHHIEGLEAMNVLVNHWWRDVPAYMGAPGDALLHAILEIRDLPARQRKVWREIFDHYVFGFMEEAVEHVPRDRRGVLGDLDDDAARKIRALLRNKLNR
jgi:hypothetical protein